MIVAFTGRRVSQSRTVGKSPKRRKTTGAHVTRQRGAVSSGVALAWARFAAAAEAGSADAAALRDAYIRAQLANGGTP